ncbi:tRNA(Met)-cytidine N(4)-acetyltransferase [Volucribacter psittacicida]|uniref:tRNA(Met) cytidine acetyltransferase TmcA n=1 Tax=Volucribacter psittacicida TaxID=203482 RepID=A0A4R1FXH5_9PAST|nr:tRNA(Met)-cytidine N(4)-acetyltransferase [Volucribacter psittacicida]
MLARSLYILDLPKKAEIPPHFISHFIQDNLDEVLWIGDTLIFPAIKFVPFSQTRNLLGQEFSLIIYDGRQQLHLESLAIVSGTLKAGGAVLMLVENWQSWQQQPDKDSLRWHSATYPVSAVNFRQYFKQCYDEIFHANFILTENLPHRAMLSPHRARLPHKRATEPQQAIIEQILLQQAKYYVVTAKRGRGKSALAGLLANHLTSPIYITAANKSAVNILQKFCQKTLQFIAPDELARQLTLTPQKFAQAWLLVDEATRLPLQILHKLSGHFQHILFTTTVDGYEGTGQGFLLKFLPNLEGKSQVFHLDFPLRWREQDPLEGFVNKLLLLNEKPTPLPIKPIIPSQVKLIPCSQRELIAKSNNIEQFYRLLAQAHYRTTPIDLRRLFDGDQQQFWLAKQQEQIVGGIWGIFEGGMKDNLLIQQILQGTRRPKGNLVAQLLCFQQQLPSACQLRSLRISRIALQPEYQQQGIGSALLQQLQQQCLSPSVNALKGLDYLSVSFGYQARLAQFWQQAGFELVYLGEHKEASTGYYNAIAIYPLSEQGKQLCQQAQSFFRRDIGLQSHPLSLYFGQMPLDWRLCPQDQQSLQNFAQWHRTFYAALPAIQRLILQHQDQSLALLLKQKDNYSQKQWLSLMRDKVRQYIAL